MTILHLITPAEVLTPNSRAVYDKMLAGVLRPLISSTTLQSIGWGTTSTPSSSIVPSLQELQRQTQDLASSVSLPNLNPPASQHPDSLSPTDVGTIPDSAVKRDRTVNKPIPKTNVISIASNRNAAAKQAGDAEIRHQTGIAMSLGSAPPSYRAQDAMNCTKAVTVPAYRVDVEQDQARASLARMQTYTPDARVIQSGIPGETPVPVPVYVKGQSS